LAEISLYYSLQRLFDELFADLFADLNHLARMPAKRTSGCDRKLQSSAIACIELASLKM
jgi:hypothetical protein